MVVPRSGFAARRLYVGLYGGRLAGAGMTGLV
jgi:hypothetical protein